MRDRWQYRLTIPWVWLIVAIISWRFPGDEYGLFGVANGLPSAWISLWLGFNGGPNDIIPIMVASSFTSMLLISWAMDGLRVPRWLVLSLWLIGTVVLFQIAFGQFESYARAIAKNGSLTAYVTASSNLSLFLTCVCGILLTGCYRVARCLFPARSVNDGCVKAD